MRDESENDCTNDLYKKNVTAKKKMPHITEQTIGHKNDSFLVRLVLES